MLNIVADFKNFLLYFEIYFKSLQNPVCVINVFINIPEVVVVYVSKYKYF